MQAAVAGIRKGVRDRLCVRIKRDINGSVLPPRTDAAALAGFVMTVMQGLSVLARDRATRASLLRIVEATLEGWPGGA